MLTLAVWIKNDMICESLEDVDSQQSIAISITLTRGDNYPAKTFMLVNYHPRLMYYYYYYYYYYKRKHRPDNSFLRQECYSERCSVAVFICSLDLEVEIFA